MPTKDKESPTSKLPTVEAAAAPDPNELVSIFNKNPPGGDFVHHVYEQVKDADGRVVRDKVAGEFRAAGRDFSNVPRWLADMWKKKYPATIVDGASVSRGRTAGPADSEKVAALSAENAEYKRRIDNLEKMVAEIQANPEGKR